MQKSDVQLFIGGEWRKTANTLPIINPADETEIGRVSVAEREDLESTLQARGVGISHGVTLVPQPAPQSS